MEKRIEEKYSGSWRAIWLFAALPIILGLTMPFGSWIAGHGFVDALLPMAEVEATVITLMGFGWLLSKDQKTTWFLRDDGLHRVGVTGRRTAVTWDQIQKMKLTGFGLMILWNETDHDTKREIIYDERRSFLGIGEKEAKELISSWQEKKPAALEAREIHKASYRVRSGDAGRNAGKLFFLGILGLLGVVLTMLKKDWLMAALCGLLSVTAFDLTSRLNHPSASKRRSLVNWLILFLLMLIIICIGLVEHKMGLDKK